MPAKHCRIRSGYGIIDISVKGSCRPVEHVVGCAAMRVKLLPQNKIFTLPGHMRVAVLLEKLALLPDTVMVIRGDHLLTAEELVQDEDEIEVRSVISGGV
jgi:sulfur carrier protein